MSVSRNNTRHPPAMQSAWELLKGFGVLSQEGVRHMVLPSSLEVLFVDITPRAPMDDLLTIDRAPLVFSFHMAGAGRAHLSYSLGRKEIVDGTPGKVIISYSPGTTCRTELAASRRYHIFSIYVSPKRLFSLLGEDLAQVPPRFHALLQGREQSPFAFVSNISPQTRMILNQINDAPYRGTLRRLHLESMSMALIIRQMYEGLDAAPPCLNRKFRPDDIERIHHAKAILFQELDDPPALAELAARVGVNATKLKTGFRQVFGTTAYAMVRMERIERSRRLLNEGRLNITQIGQQLGFSDTSHFIREFAKHYGTTPGKFVESLQTSALNMV